VLDDRFWRLTRRGLDAKGLLYPLTEPCQFVMSYNPALVGGDRMRLSMVLWTK
jgi:hypothetical protein